MTDKQIIFDDVDVKDCIAYAKLQEIYLGNTLYKQMEKVCMVKNMPCKYFDCQFKQMARELKLKEQECERLKEQLADMISQSALLPKFFGLTADEITNMLKQFDQLKAENDELKKQVDDLLHKPEIQDKIIWKIDNEALLGSKDAYIYKLKQTLTEIKEIATENSLAQVGYNPDWDLILQKISECEVENE